MGLLDRLAGERAAEITVAQAAVGENTLAKMLDVGRKLKNEDGANTIVLGCAGMAVHRRPLERELGIPVIDPTQAAVTMALGVLAIA